MQENEFEKRIREKMNELQLVPGEDVWKRVSAKIHKEKRKKRFIIFLLAFGFLLGSAGTYFYINSDSIQSPLAVENSREERQNLPITKDADITKDGDVSNDKTANDTLTPSQKPITIASNKKIEAAEKIEEATNGSKGMTAGARNITARNNLQSEVSGTNIEAEVERSTPAKSSKEIGKSLQAQNVNDGEQNAPVQQAPVAKADPFKEDQLEKQVAQAKKDSASQVSSESKPTEKIKITANKKWNLGFTVFTGISNNLSRIKFFPATANYSNASPAQSSTGQSNAPINKLSYKSGLSYGLGIYVKKMVSKKSSFSAGVNYHYASATSLAGARNSAAASFYDAGLQNTSLVNEYFANGQSSEYTNKYHLVELPLNLLIQLNKNPNRRILLTTGISPAYLVGSTALYANSNQNVYYAANDQFRKIQLAAQTGFLVTVSNARRFNITAGPEVQFGFNNMAKPATSTNQHLFTAAVKVNIDLK